MIVVYGSVQSRALRVLWMADELGVPYEHRDWAPRAAETRTPEYRALNPNCRIPTLVDGDFALSESMAITVYLARRHESSLYPGDLKDEARILQWSLWETDRLDRQLVAHYAHTVRLPEDERDPKIADAAWKDIMPAFDVLETALTPTGWLVGDAFSIADLNVASALYRALSMDMSKWPRVQAWLGACWERPAAKRLRALRDSQ